MLQRLTLVGYNDGPEETLFMMFRQQTPTRQHRSSVWKANHEPQCHPARDLCCMLFPIASHPSFPVIFLLTLSNKRPDASKRYCVFFRTKVVLLHATTLRSPTVIGTVFVLFKYFKEFDLIVYAIIRKSELLIKKLCQLKVLMSPQHSHLFTFLWIQRRAFKNTKPLYHLQYPQCAHCCPHGRSRRLWWILLRSTIISSSWSRTLDKWPQYSQTEPTGLFLSIFLYLSDLSWFLYPFYLSPRIQSLPAPVEGKLHCRGWTVCVCVCVCVCARTCNLSLKASNAYLFRLL